MATQQQIPQSIFPDYPRQSPLTDKEGNINHQWDLGLGSLFQALQKNFKNEGIVFPPLTGTHMGGQMATIQAMYTPFIGQSYDTLTKSLPDISSQTVYDSTTQISNQFVIAKDNSGNVTLAEWVPFAMMLTNAGTPDLVLAGVLNWLCYDITNKVLYACYLAGAAGTARWASL